MTLIKVLSLISLIVLTAAINVNVMLPLDTVTNEGTLKDPTQLASQLSQLADAGVHGVHADVWWGVTEVDQKKYNFSAYHQLVNITRNAGLHFAATLSFHRCGGNVGDTCDIPIPSWVTSVDSNAFYHDFDGNINYEYIGLQADNEPLWNGETALDLYNSYIKQFATEFSDEIGRTIDIVYVGMGPAGELRYPSYPLKYWSFPGVGEFQCYDSYSIHDFQVAANKSGHPEWQTPPSDAGQYDSWPHDTSFFTNGYKSDYGQFFLSWYSGRLLQHASSILSSAQQHLSVEIAGKVAGIHWQYKDPSHAAELTAGYYNTNGNTIYSDISHVFHTYHAGFDFTCLEMADNEQQGCNCAPEELVSQTESAASDANVPFQGENALPRYDQTAYDHILRESCLHGPIAAFTYLRLDNTLLSGDNWTRFTAFVQAMSHAC